MWWMATNNDMLKYFFAWLPMVAIAIANGVMRGVWYEKKLGELLAHQVSTASIIILLGVYIGSVMYFWRPESITQALAVGLLWLGLTVAFEFLFGHYVAGHSWRRLMADYNLFAGRVWILVPLWVALAPVIFYRLQAPG